MEFKDLINENKDQIIIEKNIIKTISDITKDLIGKKIIFKFDEYKNSKMFRTGNIKDIQFFSFKKILKIILPDGSEDWFTLKPDSKFKIQLV